MKKLTVWFLLLLFPIVGTLAQDKSDWTSWLPAKNATYQDQYGIDHDRTDFSYRWRNSIPCSGKDCSFDLQVHNKGDSADPFLPPSMTASAKGGTRWAGLTGLS
jgi:hypothetical protein